MARFAKLFLIALGVFAIFVAGVFFERTNGLSSSPSSAESLATQLPLLDLANTDVHIFLLAGQSNMDGRGDIDEYTPPPRTLSERVFVFGEDYTLSVGQEPVSRGGVGPSIAFAAAYLEQSEDSNVSVVLVPAAKGATSLAEWKPSKMDGSLYAEAVKRTLAASHLGEIKGMLFFQGESDALTESENVANTWNTTFEQVATEIRGDLNLPQLPIVFAQLGAGDSSNWQTVKTAQANVDLANSAMITTDDLEYGDDVHFTTASYIEIGRRFANAMIDLQKAIG